MDIDFDNLALAGQVLTRQHAGATAIGGHIATYGELSPADMGLVLGMFRPLNEALLATAAQVTGLSAQVFELGAQKMAETRQAYVDAERTAYEAAAEVAAEAGLPVPPYSAPATPTLGAAQQSAGAHYGDADGDLFSQAFWDGNRAVDWTDGAINQVGARWDQAVSGSTTVHEAVDIGSYLPTPDGSAFELEDIRWSAGVVFGSVDWIWEQLFGWSLLGEISKPFTGDWQSLKEASIAWTHAGDALSGVAQNCSALCPPMARWTGQGSEAFLVAAGAMAETHMALSGPCGTVSTLISALASAVKFVVGKVLGLLKDLSYRLLAMAVGAAVPVAGWLVDGIIAAATLVELLDEVRDAYALVNMLYDLVSGMVSGQTQLLDSASMIADLVEGLARATAARVG